MAEQDQELADDEIQALPTKSLFVEILTRDIALDRAVIDLVDNSVDGARRLRPGDDSRYDGFQITVDLSDQHFTIVDNCGGIGVEVARKYAFRFGRAPGFTDTPGSIGQFGVGMKRALFKFGLNFTVDSTTRDDHFVLRVDVDDWLTRDPKWRFKFQSTEYKAYEPEQCGTRIVVWNLRPNTAKAFGLQSFRNQLKRAVQSAQQHSIDRGLEITVDGTALIATTWELMTGTSIDPGRIDRQIDLGDGKPVVNVRIFSGVSASSPTEAGWYVFCNGRLVLGADQSDITGWRATAATHEVAIPKFHNQFARFRGLVFFDCKDASLLPWDTTKTGVDSDSNIYQAALPWMIEAMRPVVDFLNALDRETDLPQDARPLQSELDRARPVRLAQIERQGPFMVRAPAGPPPEPATVVSYRRPREQVEELMEAFGARTNREVGERSFDMARKQLVGDK